MLVYKHLPNRSLDAFLFGVKIGFDLVTHGTCFHMTEPNCRYCKDCTHGLEDEVEHHPGHRSQPALPPRELLPEDCPPGPQGQQCAPRQQEDLRLRHGQDLRGRGDRGWRPESSYHRWHGWRIIVVRTIHKRWCRNIDS